MTNHTDHGVLERLFWGAASWTGLGLASGLYYREFTRSSGFKGFTQLALSHTHALALGTLVLLIALVLAKLFPLATTSANRFFAVYNAGLVLTFGMLTFKGSLQILGDPLANSPALAGVSGLGHMILTGAFVYFFVILRRGLKASRPVDAPRPEALTVTS